MSSAPTPHTGSGIEPMVRIGEVWKEFPTAGEPLEILRGVTMEVAAGEIVTIVGASGSGKSGMRPWRRSGTMPSVLSSSSITS